MAKKELGLDSQGMRKVMRTRDYMADMGGQFALGVMGNLVGQLTYFYTDKVGMAVGAIGVMMAIAKVLDALTDIIFGNIIDHSRGGDKKYFKWMLIGAIPAALVTFLLFTVPREQTAGLIYVLVTNILFTAVIYTIIATPFAAVMVVRTNSQEERAKMGVFRAVGSYGAGMVIAIATIPVTNILGGTQSAWIKYGAALALLVLLMFLLCWNNGRKAKFASEYTDDGAAAPQEEEEAPVPFKNAIGMLFRNKYWVIVLLFNLITQITNSITAASGTYYCKWIFGNDNLVAILGAAGLGATVVGFIFSNAIIKKMGVRNTIYLGLLGAAAMAGIRCFAPANYIMYIVTGLIGSFVQIPLMCLYGVLMAMAVDYNEWKYDKKLVAISSGAIGFGSKVGGSLGGVLLTAVLALGHYDPTLAAASDSMRASIYTIGNYVPLVINFLMFLIFTQFDLEKKLPHMREEVAARKAARENATEE